MFKPEVHFVDLLLHGVMITKTASTDETAFAFKSFILGYVQVGCVCLVLMFLNNLTLHCVCVREERQAVVISETLQTTKTCIVIMSS